MAKLDRNPYPGIWDKLEKETWEQYDYRTSAMFTAIPQDKIISFPWADGRAFYFIKSTTPLILQWIPYSDAWQVPDAYIRGIRISDIQKR